jgi:hypothetical protein
MRYLRECLPERERERRKWKEGGVYVVLNGAISMRVFAVSSVNVFASASMGCHFVIYLERVKQFVA